MIDTQNSLSSVVLLLDVVPDEDTHPDHLLPLLVDDEVPRPSVGHREADTVVLHDATDLRLDRTRISDHFSDEYLHSWYKSCH